MAKRDAREVPIQEASNAICRVLYERVGLFEGDLIREAARQMGYTRSSSAVTELLQSNSMC